MIRFFFKNQGPGILELITGRADFSTLAIKYLLEMIQNPAAAPKDVLFDPVVFLDVVQLIVGFGMVMDWKKLEPAGSDICQLYRQQFLY